MRRTTIAWLALDLSFQHPALTSLKRFDGDFVNPKFHQWPRRKDDNEVAYPASRRPDRSDQRRAGLGRCVALSYCFSPSSRLCT